MLNASHTRKSVILGRPHGPTPPGLSNADRSAEFPTKCEIGSNTGQKRARVA